MHNQINEAEFYSTYRPVQNHITASSGDQGRLFETYGADFNHVIAVDKERPGTVWTLTDNGSTVSIVSGLHRVNRLGYYITEIEVPDGTTIEAVDPDAIDDDDEDY